MEEWPVFFSMLKVQLVEATDAREKDAIVELLHIPPSLQDDSRVSGTSVFLVGLHF